jgi:hypothetical protein
MKLFSGALKDQQQFQFLSDPYQGFSISTVIGWLLEIQPISTAGSNIRLAQSKER